MKWIRMYKKGSCEFSLLERRFDSHIETTYKITTSQLDVVTSTRECDGEHLFFANINTNNNEKLQQINQIPLYSSIPLKKQTKKDVLNGFRGAIIGYPFIRLSVYFLTNRTEVNPILCDVVEFEGGQWAEPPYCRVRMPFRINFYKFRPNGEVYLIDQMVDVTCRFLIKGQDFDGQIPSRYDSSGLLNPYEVMEFIHKCKRGYMGRPPHNWEEVLGNKKDDSTFDYLSFDIREEFIFLTYTKNLRYKSGKIFNKDVEWSESTDRHLWATYRFQSSYHLIKLINQISQIADIIQQDKEYYSGDIEYQQIFKFKESISKSEFESATGIHLSEFIITTHHRY